jgi:hypothetical protein
VSWRSTTPTIANHSPPSNRCAAPSIDHEGTLSPRSSRQSRDETHFLARSRSAARFARGW